MLARWDWGGGGGVMVRSVNEMYRKPKDRCCINARWLEMEKSILRFCCIMQSATWLNGNSSTTTDSSSGTKRWEKHPERERARTHRSTLAYRERKTDKPCSPVYFNLKQFSILIPRETGLMHVIFKLILIFRFALVLERFRISTFYWVNEIVCACISISISRWIHIYIHLDVNGSAFALASSHHHNNNNNSRNTMRTRTIVSTRGRGELK